MIIQVHTVLQKLFKEYKLKFHHRTIKLLFNNFSRKTKQVEIWVVSQGGLI